MYWRRRSQKPRRSPSDSDQPAAVAPGAADAESWPFRDAELQPTISLLEPVKRGRAPSLSDRAAKRPRDLPDRDELRERTQNALDRLNELQNAFYADGRHALLVVLQGRDASGKDGVIRHVFGACNPQGVHVTTFKVPSDLELAHDYLWRVHVAVPPRSMIGIFNRSHYEDVLVVRVRNLVPRAVWSRRYDQINAFERILAENGVIILKFFLHISREEQREQLIERLDDPRKNWKFRAGDLEDRQLWDEYTRAYRDALAKCSTKWAPWYVVPADDKKARNYLVTRTIVDKLESLDLKYPKAPRDVLALKGSIV
jgi:PPK2 family polyphosphate:nucleotide phosphotransferase